MGLNIFVGAMAVIAFGIGIWGWCSENIGSKEHKPEQDDIPQEHNESNKI
jgi:hypothetical protein